MKVDPFILAEPSSLRDYLLQWDRSLSRVRAWFAERQILEVMTDLLRPVAVPDANLQLLTVLREDQSVAGYLQSSPELAMKLLLSQGSGSIYHLNRCFRGGETGRWHSEEFTMLEWYRPHMTLEELIDEVISLLSAVSPQPDDVTKLPIKRMSYQQAWLACGDLDPFACDRESLEKALIESFPDQQSDWQQLQLAELQQTWMGLVVEPSWPISDGIRMIDGFPAEQSMLARLDEHNPQIARRFEMYLDRVEIANGFDELVDPIQQKNRFEQELLIRRERGQPIPALDTEFLDAIGNMPPTVGVAVGLERVFSLLHGYQQLRPLSGRN